MNEVKGKKLWKVYFWLLIILTSLALVATIDAPEDVFIGDNIFSIVYEIVMMAIFIISLMGLYGFIYERKYFSRDFWIFILCVSLIESISEVLGEYHHHSFMIILGISMMFIPLYYSLYKYAIRMKYIWDNNE